MSPALKLIAQYLDTHPETTTSSLDSPKPNMEYISGVSAPGILTSMALAGALPTNLTGLGVVGLLSPLFIFQVT